MSKNIVIQEGGLAKQLTADKLKTNLVGGGTCLWVPEDGTRLGTKHITENGTYKAIDDGLYGFSEVTVSGIGSVTGKDPDGSGDEATATVDPETGEITITKLPSRIEVTTPPTNPYGIYQDGQTITTEGMVVKAYLESGAEYGTVPIGEITIEPTTAVYDSATDQGGTAVSDIEAIESYMPIPISSSVYVYDADGILKRTELAPPGGAITAYQMRDGDRVTFIYASGEPYHNYSSYTRDGKTVYYASLVYINGGYNVNPCTLGIVPQTDGYFALLAWTMIYGTITRAGSHQTINVSWPRPGDGKVLETTFEILVAPGYTPGGEE